ncbi:MAG TPA: hypothetical protein VGD05_02285 [Pyrinomonadaceae bacterium]|jgi:hypothetical protein
MSKFYQLDANHKNIADHLRRFGVSVYEAANVGKGVPDLIIHKFETGFLEIKIEGSGASFKRPQIIFMSSYKFHIGIARTKEEALAFALDPRGKGLSQKVKDRLAGLLLRDSRKAFTANEIEKLIEGK